MCQEHRPGSLCVRTEGRVVRNGARPVQREGWLPWPHLQRRAGPLGPWFGGWLGLGGLMVYGAYSSAGDERMYLIVSLAFWAFFFVRILKVILWRRIGSEIIKITSKEMMVKDAFKTRGKERFYYLERIGNIEVIERKEASFFSSLDQSFWILGGDNIHFNYKGKTNVLGKQLSQSDAMQLCNYLNKSIARYLKKK